MDQIRDNRLHKILEIIITEFPKDRWYYSELSESLSKPWRRMSIYKIKHLCEILSKDNMFHFHADKDYIHTDRICVENARRAYHGEKYKEQGGLFSVAVGLARIVGVGVTALSVAVGYMLNDQKKTINKLQSEKEVLLEQNQKSLEQRDSLLYLLERKELGNQEGDSLQ